MTKKSNKTGKSKPKNIAKAGVKQAIERFRERQGGELANYRRLLLDPCNAPFTAGPSMAPGTGMFLRLRKYITPTIATATATGSAQIRWSPHLNKLVQATNANSATAVPSSVTEAFTVPAHIQSYRTLAACMKWVSESPISARQGTVGAGYAPSRFIGVDTSANDLLACCSKVYGNGADSVEVKWFPGEVSELDFVDIDEDGNVATPSEVFFALRNLDMVSGTPSYFKGQIELTWVIEITPKYAGGIMPSAVAPPKFNLQDVLRSIGSLAKDAVRSYGPGIAHMALNYATVSGPAMLMA